MYSTLIYQDLALWTLQANLPVVLKQRIGSRMILVAKSVFFPVKFITRQN